MNKAKLQNVGLILGVVMLLSIVACSCAPGAKEQGQEPLEEVALGLSWIHQAQFTGEYYADQKGIYEREGLDVTLVPAQIDKDPLESLIAGELDFVIAQPDRLIQARANGAEVEAIAATYRLHPLVFCSLADSGISKPQDFAGRTVGVAYSEEIMLKAMLTKLGVDVGAVDIVPRDYNFDGLTSGRLDVQGAWLTDEVQTAKRGGIEFRYISPYDYGIIFYADVITTTEDMIKDHPELVEGLLRATLEGWVQGIGNPEKHSKLTLLYNEGLDAVHERDVLLSSLPLIHTGEDEIGWMRASVWRDMHDMLLEQGLIEKPIEIDRAYTMDFLHEIYGR